MYFVVVYGFQAGSCQARRLAPRGSYGGFTIMVDAWLAELALTVKQRQ